LPRTYAVGTTEGGGKNVEVQGYYYFSESVDLGEAYTSRLTATLNAEGVDLTNVIANWSSLASVALLDNSQPEDWGVEVQYRSTNSDPSSDDWSDWQPLVVGDVTARAFEFRLRLNGLATIDSNYSTISPLVHGVKVSVDMPDRVASEEDIAVPTGGSRITFSDAFISLKGVAIAAQNMSTGDYYTINNKDNTGFNIRFFNASNSPVARTFDYLAKGYGVRI